MLSFLNKYVANHFASQNGEEGCLIEICQRLDLKHGHAVEIGGADGLYCSNTALLLKDHGWSGLFVEADYSLYQQSKVNWANNPRVRHQCSRVDGKNVNAFVGSDCDLLSIDTDGKDFEIFRGMAARPKIVIAEIDSGIPPDRHEFNADGGAGYLPMLRLAQDKGYFLLCHTGNVVMMRGEFRPLFPEVVGDGLSNPELYFNRAWL